MITYENGRFRSHRPVAEAEKLLQEEIKSLTDPERKALDLLIQELALKQNRELADAATRLEWDPDTGPAAPIRQWVNDEHLLGETARTLWPKLKDDMVEFFEGDYSECVLTGCVDKQALVQCSDGSMPTLGSLIGRKTKVVTVHEKEGVGHHETTEGVDSGTRRVLELTLRNGMRVRLTPDHRVLTQRGWVRADQLNIESDYVLRPRKISYRPSNFSLRDEEVKLLAYMATDGSSSDTRARYCDGRKATGQEFIESLKALSFDSTKPEPYAKGNAWEVSVSCYITGGFRDWLKGHDACGVSCHNAEVPDAVCRAPKRQVALFLNRVWAAEGMVVYKAGSPPRFQLSMTSEKFIRQVQLLLLRWGIQGRYREYTSTRGGTTTTGYCLQVTGKENLSLFIKHIGPIFSKGRETAELEKVIEAKTSSTNVDVVPFSYEDGATILKANKVSRRGDAGDSLGWNRLCRSHSKFSRTMFKTFCEEFSDLPEVQTLTTAFPPSVAYERIKTLKEVKHPVGVADVGVPGPTRFTANGISVHNSTRWG
jgi:replicative DNA helicase